MSYQSRGLMGPSRKRKEKEALHLATSSSTSGAEPPLPSYRLLAGYMAYEFLAKGTLFGEKFHPNRAEAEPVQRYWKRRGVGQSSEEAEPLEEPKVQSYFEVANLVRNKAAHVPGVVNPTQLARWVRS